MNAYTITVHATADHASAARAGFVGGRATVLKVNAHSPMEAANKLGFSLQSTLCVGHAYTVSNGWRTGKLVRTSL